MNSMTRNTSAGTVATIAAAAMLPGAPAEVAARLSPQMNTMTRNTSAGTVATIAAAAVIPGAPAEVAARLQVRAAALRHWGALDRSSDWQGFAAAAHEARTSCRKSTHVLFENDRSVLTFFFAVRCCFAAHAAEGSERAIGSSPFCNSHTCT
jgi:hypothetical protein